MSGGVGGCSGILIRCRGILFVGVIIRMADRDWSEAWAKVEQEGRCRVGSGCVGRLDPAHVIPRSQVRAGPGENGRNIAPLCRKHHELYDTGRLDLLPYLSEVEQAYAVLLVGYERAGRYMRGQRRPDRAVMGVTADGSDW